MKQILITIYVFIFQKISEGLKASGPPGGYSNQQPRAPRPDIQGPVQPPHEDQRPQPSPAAPAATPATAGRGARGGFTRWNNNRTPQRPVLINALFFSMCVCVFLLWGVLSEILM